MAEEITTVEEEFYKVEFTPSKIVIDHKEELEETIKSYANKYKDQVVTADTLAEAKSTRSDLNNVFKTLDDKRKQVKKEYNQPLKEFEEEIKKISEIIHEVVVPIDKGIRELEEQERKSKLDEIDKQLNQRLETESEFIAENFEKNPKWANKTYTIKKIASEFEEQIEQLRKTEEQILANREIIANYAKAVSVEAEGWVSLLDTGHTAPEIMKMIDKLVADKKAREQAEIEQKKKAKEFKLTQAAETEFAKQPQEAGSSIDLDQSNENEEEGLFNFEDLFVPPVKTKESVELRITGTQNQLEALNDYIISSGLDVEVI